MWYAAHLFYTVARILALPNVRHLHFDRDLLHLGSICISEYVALSSALANGVYENTPGSDRVAGNSSSR